jgi:hypothetical protein
MSQIFLTYPSNKRSIKMTLSMEQGGDDTDRGKTETSTETPLSAILFIINLTQTGMGWNPGLRGERPATNKF